MQNNTVLQNSISYNKALNTWFEELALPVAPACNMMCNFCSKDSDCICNGNSPEYLSKSMTPKQAVDWALSQTNRNKRIKVIKICGPGEPLCNTQTFEVLRRLNIELPEHIYAISTNGLLLEEKVGELARLNVKIVSVAMNAVYIDTMLKLYSRIIKGSSVIVKSQEMADAILGSQIQGMKLCIGMGINVKINAIYFPGINYEDIIAIAKKCRDIGVKSISIISSYPNGKFIRTVMPSIGELAALQQELSKIVRDVEIKSFIPANAGTD